MPVRGVPYLITKRFLYAGRASGTRFKRPARGYERRKEKMSLTVIVHRVSQGLHSAIERGFRTLIWPSSDLFGRINECLKKK
jgi:hypothetical protein